MRTKIILALLFTLLVPRLVFAYVYYETVETNPLSRGVNYSHYSQITDRGYRDVYVTTVQIKEPHIKLNPVESNQVGFKQPVSQLLSDSSVIAGVNGDFFGLVGKYSASFGPVVKDDILVSFNSLINKNKNEYASFFIDKQKNPFILYPKTQLDFFVEGEKRFDVISQNKITDMVHPTYIDSVLMENTRALDERFPGLVKLVVQKDKIIKISQKGESVDIPKDGFAIVISSNTADYNLHQYKVGQRAVITRSATVNFDNISTAIGGGGRILLDGQPVNDGMVVTGLQPRTAIGISQDKSKIILMVVDGRGQSVGATHEEMGELLKRFGAFNAMHLDGGGSSTMVVKDDKDNLTVVNNPSQGAQRNVINALGIFNKASVGEIQNLRVVPEQTRVFAKTPINIKVYGEDYYLNKIQIPPNQVRLVSDDVSGTFKDGFFYPQKTGTINFTAAYQNLSATASVTCMDISAIRPQPSSIVAGVGGKVSLSFNGVSPDGYEAFIYNSGVQFEVVPPELGYIEYGNFVASNSGSGYIRCSLGEATAYINVTVGFSTDKITSFEDLTPISFVGLPETVTGSVSHTNAPAEDGFIAAKLDYKFLPGGDGNQIAYLTFNKPFQFNRKLMGLKISVHGDNSGNWLRARLKDANGNDVYVNLAQEINWTGYKTIEASIPSSAAQPLSLERLYVVSNGGTLSGSVCFDNVAGVFLQEYPPLEHPPATQFTDRLQGFQDEMEGFDVTVLGDINKSGSEKFSQAVNNFLNGASIGIIAGESDAGIEAGVPVYRWNPSYYMHGNLNINIVQLTAAKGGLHATDSTQWAKIKSPLSDNKEHVIFIMDLPPQRFSSGVEYKMFHEAMKDIQASGKSVFVISTEGLSTTAQAKDGIRYINLGGFNYNDGLNPDFKNLRLRIKGKEIRYRFE